MISTQLLIEALVVGLMTVILGYILHVAYTKIGGVHDLNNMKVYLIHLFVIGLSAHLLCEASGINKYYCKNGNSCKN